MPIVCLGVGEKRQQPLFFPWGSRATTVALSSVRVCGTAAVTVVLCCPIDWAYIAVGLAVGGRRSVLSTVQCSTVHFLPFSSTSLLLGYVLTKI